MKYVEADIPTHNKNPNIFNIVFNIVLVAFIP